MEHEDIPLGELHVAHNWEYADAAEREAAAITDSNVLNRLALQLDDKSLWMLVGADPAAWEPMGGAAKADTSALESHVGATSNPHGVTKVQVGLSNVDNTSDANKPVSAATQAALDDKADDAALAAHLDDNANPHAVTKAQVGLANVDNTSDENKPISTAAQAALDIKAAAADLASHTGNTSNPHSTTKTQVGLANVDNTSDANKPVSTATQAALDAKETTIGAGTTGQYWRGDKSWQALNASSVGLDNVDNTSDANKPVSTATQAALDAKAGDAALSAHTGNTSNPHGVTKAQVGLSNVDNTSDSAKPVSTATQTALDAKASVAALASHTGDMNNPHGVDKADVGLGNVDNTSDINKPVSTAQAAADTVILNQSKAYTDQQVTGIFRDRGNYDASSNTFPSTGGSGTSGAIRQGDLWTITVAGTLGSETVDPRQTVRALIDTPGQTAANWAIGLANTDIEDAINDGVIGRAPSQNAVFDALALKAGTTALSAHTGATNNPHSTTKSQVGLSNVDNTSDANKPVSTAAQTALNAKENSITAGTTSQYWRGDKSWVSLAADVRATVLTGIDITVNAVISATDSALTALGKLQKQITDNLASLTAHTSSTSNPHSTTKSQVGLSNVDNTSDANKPISTAAQTAINAKEPAISAGTTGQYWRGDKSWQTLNAGTVGLGSVENKSSATIRGEITSGNVTNALTYTPVQLGTGVGQSFNLVKIGWGGAGNQKLLLTVDTTDFSSNWPISVQGVAAGSLPLTGGTLTGNLTGMAFRAAQGAPTNDSSPSGFAFGADGDTGIFSPVIGGGGANGVVAIFTNNAEATRFLNGRSLFGTTTDNGLDRVQVNGNISLSGPVNPPSGPIRAQLGQDAAYGAQIYGRGTTNDVTIYDRGMSERIAVSMSGVSIKSALTVDGSTLLSGSVTITGPLTLNGTTTTINSVTTTLDDPVVTLGGDTAPASNDGKDRGIEFRWHDGTNPKVGFFGFDRSTGRMTFIPDATNTSEVFSGTVGTIEANVIGNVAGTASAAPFSGITGKPTTRSGYGITDAEATIAAGTTGQYWRGDKSWQTLDKAAVGLGNVDNTSDANKPVSTATQTALDAKANASTAVSTTGAQTLTNKTLIAPIVANQTEGYTTASVGAGGTYTIDLGFGPNFEITITGNNPFIYLPAPVPGKRFYVDIVYTGAFTFLFAVTTGQVRYANNGTPPAQTAAAFRRDRYMFSVNMGGAAQWFVTDLGRAYVST